MSVYSLLIFYTSIVMVIARLNYTIDERWVCSVKQTCLECLKLTHCSWCKSENKCFSANLPASKNDCANSTVINHDETYGLSLEENADCSCVDGKKDMHCYPPGTTEGPECSDRGMCRCGHCVCDPNPDPQNPTKIIMGEYCEFDNFSCDGPRCNEGPYSISQPGIVDYDDGYKNDDNADTRR